MKGFIAALFIFSIVSFLSCTKTNTGTGNGGNTSFVPNCNGAATGFSANVFPIFQSVCGQSNCHNTGSVNGPGPLTNHAQISAATSNIRAAIISGIMPKNTTLTAAQKNSIICWIDAGAANN